MDVFAFLLAYGMQTAFPWGCSCQEIKDVGVWLEMVLNKTSPAEFGQSCLNVLMVLLALSFTAKHLVSSFFK